MRGAKRRGAVPAKRRRGGSLFWGCLALLLFVLCGFWAYRLGHPGASLTGAAGEEEIPAYAGEDVIVLGGNLPAFAEEELTRESFVRFSPFDALGRTGAGTACLWFGFEWWGIDSVMFAASNCALEGPGVAVVTIAST